MVKCSKPWQQGGHWQLASHGIITTHSYNNFVVYIGWWRMATPLAHLLTYFMNKQTNVWMHKYSHASVYKQNIHIYIYSKRVFNRHRLNERQWRVTNYNMSNTGGHKAHNHMWTFNYTSGKNWRATWLLLLFGINLDIVLIQSHYLQFYIFSNSLFWIITEICVNRFVNYC